MKKSILSIFLIFASGFLYANEVQSLDIIQNKVESYVLNKLSGYTEGKVQVSADKIDSRLNLKSCDEGQLEIFNPYDTPMLNTSTMGIKCMEKENHWTLYVPVKVVVLKTVLLTKRALRKGSRLSDKDFYQAEMDSQKLRQGYFTDPKDLIGLVCKKDIQADSPLNPYNIELAKMVHRGETVTIVAAGGNLMISMDGIAMSDGVLGDLVKVKNATSKRIIEAQVAGMKKVKIVL